MKYYTIIIINYIIHTLIEISLHKLNKLTSMVNFLVNILRRSITIDHLKFKILNFYLVKYVVFSINLIFSLFNV